MPDLVQFWDDGLPPPLILQRMSDWQAKNLDWNYRCFDRQSASGFLLSSFGSDISTAFLDIRMPAMMADVFRVAYTFIYGGLWVDAATSCLSPLSVWLDTDSPLLLLRKDHMEPPIVWNGLIYASRPGHPFLDALWSGNSSIDLRSVGF